MGGHEGVGRFKVQGFRVQGWVPEGDGSWGFFHGNAGFESPHVVSYKFGSWGFFDGNIRRQGSFLIGANRQVCPTRPALRSMIDTMDPIGGNEEFRQYSSTRPSQGRRWQ